MKHLTLTLSLILGLATPVFALKAGHFHPDPFKVMTQGKVIGQHLIGSSGNANTSLILEYKGEIYKCQIQGITYRCLLLQPTN